MASENLKKSTPLFGANTVFVEELYNRYLENPASVDESWQGFFRDMGDNLQSALSVTRGASWAPHGARIVGYKEPVAPGAAPKKAAPANDIASVEQAARDSIMALMLIRAYKVRGHLLAKLDPLEIEQRDYHPDLDPATYGFSEADYDREIYIGGAITGVERANLHHIIELLHHTYCGHIGMEFMHMQSLEQRDWIAGRIEWIYQGPGLSIEEKKTLLRDIIHLETFEQFLHVKFPGAKRFSVEGGESAVAAAQVVISTAAELGMKEIIVGMPHRGRLNVLTHVMGKSYTAMLSEFQGNLAHPESLDISGDVKYHLGTSSDRKIGDNSVHLSLTANPSHLEAVNPVVVGKVRAKQDELKDTERSQVMGLLFHGDAAFAGQGVVTETLSLSDLKGYRTGGTVHIIVNNQIGFTTSPRNARFTPHPSEAAKVVQAPIFHVNGDDPEAVLKVSKIATEFRQTFKQDIVLDVVCYRRHGHNEGDEPSFTQPQMYERIRAHKTPMNVYAEKLIAEGSITEDDFRGMVKEFRDFLEKEYEASKSYKPNTADWLAGKWMGLQQPAKGEKPASKTGVKLDKLKEIGKVLSENPKDVKVHSKIVRQLEAKRTAIDTGEGIDWATGEALAFGSLLVEGTKVRLSGQDCCRGTFSQRHCVLVDQDTEARYTPLQHLAAKQAGFEVIDSNLSEFAVMGFEYGYSTVVPNSLVLWEAQFGDFANGAQVMIDQFVASAESKWLRMSGLVLLLPHGYEGQGPEHSSARLERFLQLCADDNMQVANCTTPANYFHILRRQVHRDFRKPLVLMTPKSLLRHRLAVSSLNDMKDGTSFQPVIAEVDKLDDSKVKRVVVCSGKVFYDLYEAREKAGIKDVAILRLEEFHPFPESELAKQFKRYKNADVVWCQEEPENMGGWTFVDRRIEDVLTKAGNKITRPRYVGRKAAASPAAGYLKIHNQQQAALVAEALTVK